MSLRLAIIITALTFTCMVSCEAWKWEECRFVGHSFAYCLGKVGE